MPPGDEPAVLLNCCSGRSMMDDSICNAEKKGIRKGQRIYWAIGIEFETTDGNKGKVLKKAEKGGRPRHVPDAQGNARCTL